MTNTPQLKPCPFCGDPMEWRGGDYAAHTNFNSLCPVSSQGFTYPEKWNIRTPPKVKPLVWAELEAERGDGFSEPSGDWESESIVGCYSINMGFGTDSYIWSAYRGEVEFISCHDDLDTAKTAAQADYERRILEALE